MTETCPRCLIPMQRIAVSRYVGSECGQCGLEAFPLIEKAKTYIVEEGDTSDTECGILKNPITIDGTEMQCGVFKGEV